jgi:hypothetical protein
MEEKLFLDNINDKINELQYLKLRKNTKNSLSLELTKLEKGSCPYIDDQVFSLTNALGLDQPILSFNLPERFDVATYNFLVNRLKQDIDNFNDILFRSNFEVALKTALGLSENIKTIFDQSKNAICFFQKIIQARKIGPLEKLIYELELNLKQKIQSSDQFSKNQLEKAITAIESELDHIKMNRPSHEKVVNLINSAFRAATSSSGRTVERTIINSNVTVENIISQIMVQIHTLIGEGTKRSKTELMKEIKGTLEDALFQVNESITGVFYLTNETLGKNYTFLELSLLDIVLASASVVLAFIAVFNSACLCKVASALKKARRRKDSFNNLELTPIVKKGLKFGKDQVNEVSRYSSIDTLPSPEPTIRKAYFKK